MIAISGCVQDTAMPERLGCGSDGAGLTPTGIVRVMQRRAKAAGLDHLHVHQFRHTFAHQWLSNGGQEGDLMRLAGWRSRTMLSR